MRLRPKHLIFTMASVGLGVGLGVSGLMKRDLAGPVPFLMSGEHFGSIGFAVRMEDAYRRLALFQP